MRIHEAVAIFKTARFFLESPKKKQAGGIVIPRDKTYIAVGTPILSAITPPKTAPTGMLPVVNHIFTDVTRDRSSVGTIMRRSFIVAIMATTSAAP